MVGINAILRRMLREISSGRVAMLHLGPIRDFLGLIVDDGATGRRIEPSCSDHPHPWPLETRRQCGMTRYRGLAVRRDGLVLSVAGESQVIYTVFRKNTHLHFQF